MTESGFLVLKSNILAMLDNGLDMRLTYHNRRHTEDVLFNAERIACCEGITNARELLLLKIAALFHDTGFIDSYKDHEERSCEIFRYYISDEHLPVHEFNTVISLIMATKAPQTPKSLLERILCDADLDYLGREDFFSISEQLRQEFIIYGIVENEKDWQRRQIRFLDAHRYFTRTSQLQREPGKTRHLEKLKILDLNRIY
jgi:predicted metal-dependent HD superfamily phosphohydrolase